MTIAQPEDHKSSSFTYRFKSGQTVVLPKLGDVLTFGFTRRVRAMDEFAQMATLVEEVCDTDALAVLDRMNATETAAFFEAWQADAGVSLGESAGSSTSSTSTVAPSSTTSEAVSTYP